MLCCLFSNMVKYQWPPSIVVFQLSLEIEKAPRETVKVCERNKQNINLILNPKERAWGLISQGGKKKCIRQGINEMGLALEWKSGYQLSVTLIACQTVFDYNYYSLFTTYVRRSWWMTLKLLFYYQVRYVVNCSTSLVCSMLSVYPKINNISSNYDAICQSNLIVIIPW